MPLKRPNDVVTVANEKVSIVTVLTMLGVEVDDIGMGRARKVHCPFGGLYHSDQGLSPAMRVYPDSNSAYCFSCAAYYTPVGLAAKGLDTTWRKAATHLLDRIGYRPMDLAAQFKDALEYEPEPDKALLADALKTYCRRIDPDWARRQFEPRVAGILTRCLSLLDLVTSQDDVHLWLCKCKEVMRRALQPEQVSLSRKYDVLWETLNDNGRRHP